MTKKVLTILKIMKICLPLPELNIRFSLPNNAFFKTQRMLKINLRSVGFLPFLQFLPTLSHEPAKNVSREHIYDTGIEIYFPP
jgi:hypothetical protein